MATTRSTTPTRRKSAAKPSEAPATLTTFAKKASETGKTVGKASLKVAKPLARSLKKQSPDTLAKMLLAAATPQLLNVAVRFALRNPALLLVGGAVAAFAFSRLDEEPATA